MRTKTREYDHEQCDPHSFFYQSLVYYLAMIKKMIYIYN